MICVEAAQNIERVIVQRLDLLRFAQATGAICFPPSAQSSE